MKEKEKKLLILLTVVILVLIGIVLISNRNKYEQEVEKGQSDQNAGEFVDVLLDGTKLNNSTKLSETKKVGELEISALQLTERGSQTVLLGTIKNKTTSVQGGYPAKVKIVDKQGGSIAELEAYINQVKPGEEQQFNVSSTLDYANAYDVIIEKK